MDNMKLTEATSLRRISAAAIILAASVLGWPAHADELAKQDAAKFAEQWLSLVDHGQYPASWEDTSARVHKRIPVNKFSKDLAATHRHYGDVVDRRVEDIDIERTPADFQPLGAWEPDRPDQYTIIKFESSFAKKHSVRETVTVITEGGVPRIAGYFID
jgi:hypothetical protein